MAEHKYEVFTRQGVAPFAQTGISRQWLNLSYTKRYQAGGLFTLSLPDEAPELPRLMPGNVIEIARDGITDFFGYVMGVRRHFDEHYPATAIAQFKGLDLSSWLLRRRVALPPISTQQVQYYSNTGPAEAVLKSAMLDHLISPADPARIIPGFVNEANHSPLLGTNVTINLRGEQFDAAAAGIALAGNVGYRVWLRDDIGAMEFQVYTGLNHSVHQSTQNTVTFSPGYRDLLKFDYEIDLEQLQNHLYSMGGNSSTTNRFYVEDENVASVAAWGRYEALVDAQNAYNATIAHTEAQTHLAPKVVVERVTFKPRETAQIQYLRDWTLGDTVSVFYPSFGVDLDLPIVEVRVDYSRTGGESIDVSTSMLAPDVVRQLRKMVQSTQPSQFAPAVVQLPRYPGNAGVPTIPPPVTGSSYFDTLSNTMKVFDGSTWKVITWS